MGQGGERRIDRPFGRRMHVEHEAKIDHVEHVEPEVAQIVVHRSDQLFGRESGQTSDWLLIAKNIEKPKL